MNSLAPIDPIDYLLVGHITRDLTPTGPRLGGTATYAALTAQALGQRVGIVTSWGAELPLNELRSTPIANHSAEQSTTFENIYTQAGRIQTIHFVAERLDYYHIPELWRSAPIVHLGPVAQEVQPSLIRQFPNSLRFVTPQGWLRSWDERGHIFPSEWPEASFVLGNAAAAVISTEDVAFDEEKIEEMAASCPIFVVTEGNNGGRIYWNGDVRRFNAPPKQEMDATGAGDIFAAAFFIRYFKTRDAWESARFANLLAAQSVTRPGTAGIPLAEEIESVSLEIF